jgi:hypothetical protein
LPPSWCGAAFQATAIFLCIFNFVLLSYSVENTLDWNTTLLQKLSKEFFLLHISDLKFTSTIIHLSNQTNTIFIVLCKRISKNWRLFKNGIDWFFFIYFSLTSKIWRLLWKWDWLEVINKLIT